MPPDTCPYGSEPSSCHGGAHCAITICKSKADCPSGKECKEVQACFGTVLCVGGKYWRPDAYYPQKPTMKSACPSSGYCSDGQACQTENLCVSPGSATTGMTTAQATSQQTSLATSVSTSIDTTPDAGTGNVHLGDSGCSCRLGDWPNAKALGPWLLAGVIGTAVTLLRRRRGARK